MFHGLNLNIKGEFKPMSYTTYNIQDFNNQIQKQTFVDRKFQRRLVWKEKNKKDYLQSLFRNSAESPLMHFDIASGVSYCDSELDKAELIEIPSDYRRELESSRKYFKKLLNDGFRYISLDGQNRSGAIEAYLSNNIDLSGISFKAFNGRTVNIRKKTFCSDLELDVANYINMLPCVDVKLISNRTLPQLRTTFISENDGVPLSTMEKTSALDTNIGKFVHKLSVDFAQMFQKIDNKSCNFIRKEDQDWITKICKLVRFESTQNTKVEGHAEFWVNGKLTTCEKGRVRDILENLQSVVDSEKECFRTKWKLWAVVMALYWLDENYTDYEISNFSNFAEKVVDYVGKLRADAAGRYSADVTKWYQNKKLGNEPNRSNYFEYWSSNSDVAASRNKWTIQAFEDYVCRGKSTLFANMICKGDITKNSIAVTAV